MFCNHFELRHLTFMSFFAILLIVLLGQQTEEEFLQKEKVL